MSFQASGTLALLYRLRLFRLARVQLFVRVIAGLEIFIWAATTLRAQTSVDIDLEEQTAYLLENGRPVLASPISSGRYGHLTRTGSFKILEKERTHYSSMYGKIVDARGNTIVADADADMPVPRGGKFIPAPIALLHAIHRSRRNACWISARLPCVARLCPNASAECDRVFQFRQRWNFGHCVRKNAGWPLLGPIPINLSETKQSICRPALRITF